MIGCKIIITNVKYIPQHSLNKFYYNVFDKNVCNQNIHNIISSKSNMCICYFGTLKLKNRNFRDFILLIFM